MPSLRLTFLLFTLICQPIKAFIAPTPIHFATKIKQKHQPLRLRMNFDSLAFVNEQVTNLKKSFSIIDCLQNIRESFMTLFIQGSDLTTAHIQTIGETSLAALTLVAFAQGALVMHQYATNPAGELIAPPGLTIGEEDASGILDKKDINDLYFQQEKCYQQKPAMTDKDIESILCNANDEPIVRSVKKGWYHVNTFLVFALPWLVGVLNSFAVSMRFGHLLHMTIIMGLARIYDIFHKLPEIADRVDNQLVEKSLTGDRANILVLGDSMAVGIGGVNIFDADKKSSAGKRKRTECLELSEDKEESKACGPVFPRVLARTLSQRLHKPVSWRSAGVDGGDINDIREHLLGIVKEEADKGQAPDIVVVLAGSNDLKRILKIGSGDHRASVKGFRSNLMKLAQEIHAISPKSTVVYPSLPTYRLDRNSILNVFPLTLFLDSIIGFWDVQKKQAADKCGQGVMHVGLSVTDVNNWYKEEQEQQTGFGQSKAEPPSLISADGIHPNAKCYSRWGSFLGNRIADELVGVEESNYQYLVPQMVTL
mmetsp:Transcript_2576/g.3514  ORF Transcript_2576/g.3514 Transcript_2576/m.3514 type:complete len:538 (-) Transcript_2576:1484-3097(-)